MTAAIETYDDLTTALADLVDPLHLEMQAGNYAARRMLKWSERAAVRAFRAGRILDEAHQRVRASGRALMEFYTWAEGLGYSSYRINTSLNVFKCFKDESLVEGLTVEQAKDIAGLSTKKKREPRPVQQREENKGNQKKHTASRGGVSGNVHRPDEEADDGDEEALETTATLLKLAELIEGIDQIRDQDYPALIRIEAQVTRLLRPEADEAVGGESVNEADQTEARASAKEGAVANPDGDDESTDGGI
jgi:hypothetical protein